MSEDTTFTQFKRRSNPVKTVGTWLAIAVAVVGLCAGFAKSYFVTPLVLEQHSADIKALREADTSTAHELREQRDLLLEIKGDVKALNRNKNKLEN